jgi:outer membrane protein W
VIAARANIRSEPHVDSPVIQEARSDTVHQTIGVKGEWYIIILPPDKDGIVLSGYIHQNLVEEVVEEITEAPKVKKRKQAVAQTPKPRVYKQKRETGPRSCIGIESGYSMPRENYYSDEIYYGGNFSLGISKNLSLELSGLRVLYEVEGSADGLSNGELSVIPIQLSIQVRFPVTARFIPYVLGGGGYYLNSFTLDEEIINTWDALGFDVEETIENSFGYHVGAGLDFFITGNIGINVDLKYCLVKTKGSWSLTDQIGGTIVSGDLENLSLNSIMVGAGLKFCF